jgi:hypothetical protein
MCLMGAVYGANVFFFAVVFSPPDPPPQLPRQWLAPIPGGENQRRYERGVGVLGGGGGG